MAISRRSFWRGGWCPSRFSYILDEPTRGIECGAAHADIIKLIKELCDEGLALLVASSELEEIVAFADRVAVMRDRERVSELTGAEITQDRIIEAIAR